MKTLFLTGLVAGMGISAMGAIPLTESTFTEVIREANVVTAANKTTQVAKTNMLFHAPDKVRTGTASRVEMTAPDKTITRIGANTIFTFAEGGRDILLEKGSILFHAPAGAGGGSIQYRGTAAAVLGTTMICAVLPDGRFKVMDFEGKVKVTLRSGQEVTLKAGQMIIVSPDGEKFYDLEVFNIGTSIARLVLIVGFSDELISLPLIQDAIREQNREIADGKIPGIVTVNAADFGLDIIFKPHPFDILPPQTPDFTTVPVSPVK